MRSFSMEGKSAGGGGVGRKTGKSGAERILLPAPDPPWRV